MSDVSPNMVFFRPGRDNVEICSVIEGELTVVEISPILAIEKGNDLISHALEVLNRSSKN